MKKIKVFSKTKPSDKIFKEAIKYLEGSPEKEEFLFHKYLSYSGVYKEVIEEKTYYIKVSQPKTISRAIKKRLGKMIPRALKYYNLSEKLIKLGINIVSPDYVFIDTRPLFFRKNVSFSQDFGEIYGLKGNYIFDSLLKENINNIVFFDKWIYRYLDIIILMTNNNFYHKDPNFFNFFYKDEELYMIDLDDIKEKKTFCNSNYQATKISLKKCFAEIKCSDKKIDEYFLYFDKHTNN